MALPHPALWEIERGEKWIFECHFFPPFSFYWKTHFSFQTLMWAKKHLSVHIQYKPCKTMPWHKAVQLHSPSWLHQQNTMKWYRGNFIYAPSGRTALLMQTLLMGKWQRPSWWKQGNGAIKRAPMSYNNSPAKSNPSFEAPDVWVSTKHCAHVWQTSVCRHTTITIMPLILR